jgi:hypothetical protein
MPSLAGVRVLFAHPLHGRAAILNVRVGRYVAEALLEAGVSPLC